MREADFRLIPPSLRPAQVPDSYLRLTGVNGSLHSVKGCYLVPITILGRTVQHKFYVIHQLTSNMILGSDFIHAHGLSYDSVSEKMFFDRSATNPRDGWTRAALTIAATTIVPANSSKLVPAQACVQPGLKATGGGTAIASVHSSRPISGNEALVNLSPSGHCSTIIDNLLDVDQILDRDTYIGSVERLPADHQLKELHLEDNKPLSQHPPPTAMSTEKRRFLNQQLDKLLSGMPTYTRQSYEQLIYKNHDIFSLNKFDLGRTNSFQQSIGRILDVALRFYRNALL